MKKFVTLLILVLLGSFLAFGQCGLTTIGGGGAGVGAIDSAIIDNIESRCTNCPTVACVGWELPDNFNGHVFLNSPQNKEFSIQITTQCDYLLMDSCGILPSSSNTGESMIVEFSVFEDSQLRVCGDEGDTVILYCKSMPSQQEEMFEILLDLSTCNTPTAITEPIKTRRLFEFDGQTWQQVTAMRPNMLYKEF